MKQCHSEGNYVAGRVRLHFFRGMQGILSKRLTIYERVGNAEKLAAHPLVSLYAVMYRRFSC